MGSEPLRSGWPFLPSPHFWVRALFDQRTQTVVPAIGLTAPDFPFAHCTFGLGVPTFGSSDPAASLMTQACLLDFSQR